MGLYSNTLTITQPSNLVASNNPIVFGLSTGTVGSPTFARGKIKVLAASTLNTTLVFNLTGGTKYSKTFKAVEYPDKENYFMTQTSVDRLGNQTTGSNSITDVTSSLAQVLSNDIFIGQNYYVNYSGSSIIELVAKEAGSKYNLNGLQVISSNNAKITFTNITSGSNQYEGQAIPDYSLFVDVYKGNDNVEILKTGTYNDLDFNKVSELVLPFSKINVHRFDISKIAGSFLSTPFPKFNQSGFTTFSGSTSKMMLPFKVVFGEIYSPNKDEQTLTKTVKGQSKIVWAVNSSLPFTNANQLINYTGLSTGNGSSKFLTSFPEDKYVTDKSRELLYFIVPKNIRNPLSLHADIEFWNGTKIDNRRIYTFFSGSNVNTIDNYGGVFIANVSHEYCLKAIETENGNAQIKRATFYLRYGVNSFFVWSERKSYFFYQVGSRELDDNYYPLAFLNELGSFDTFEFVGNNEKTVDRTKSSLTLPYVLNADGSIASNSRSSINYGVQTTNKIVVNSGIINQNHFDWLLQLVKSNEIYNCKTGESLKLDSFKWSKSALSNDYQIELTLISSITNNSVGNI